MSIIDFVQIALLFCQSLQSSIPFAGVWCALFAGTIKLLEDEVFAGVWYAVLLLVVAVVLLIGTLVAIARQPRSVLEMSFTAPFSPWLPGVSILINIYLMFQLDSGTWMRYGVWIAVGLCMYFGYGMWHSHERPVVKEQRRCLDEQQKQQQQTTNGAIDKPSETAVIAALTTSQDILVTEKD